MIFLRKCENCNIVTMPGLSYLGSLILTYIIVCVSEVAKGELEHVLNHYETLHIEDVFHGVHKRDIAFQEKIVSFTALGRHFRLHLTPNTDLFGEEFHAYSVGPNDVKTEIPINKESFYRGYDEDDASSEARVHDDYGVLTASIATKNETYVIEPAWRHLRQSSNEQMIAYRHSDVKSNITHSHNNLKNKTYSFCGHDSEHSTVYYKENVEQDLRSHRRKRAASTLIRCRLALVADHRFHQEMGQRDESKTVNYMIGVADRVNTIFQRTEWGSEYAGYGFEIADVCLSTLFRIIVLYAWTLFKNGDNGVNGTGAFSEGASSGRCPVGEQRRPGRHPATARMMWSKDVNKVVMECYLKSKPVNENGVPIRGYRQRMFRVWQEIGLFESTEQRICDQARAIRKNGWLSELEIEVIKRTINQEETGDTNGQGLGDATTDENMENDEVQQEEGEFDMQDEPGDDANIKELNDIPEEDRRIISEILELSKSGENNPVNFKKANQRQVEEITNRINKVIDKIPTRTITETNNLINAASMYVAKELGLKQTTQKQSKMPWWQRRIEGDIKRIRKDINLLEREKRGELRKSGKDRNNLKRNTISRCWRS
ncbi:uncharacterized protein LOC122954426 [Acropora millepora]|uniref:uncharacterized protein LOC122954426 n=1 Tax=Acropora millepora TaxID=45264 RepID=UPI001CF3915C|nr:uncharacterized protein LOC122954426 [Acropora millepora]